jgi:hypothetical protein
MNLFIRISDLHLKLLHEISTASGKENLSVQNPKFEKKKILSLFSYYVNIYKPNLSKLSDAVRLHGWWVNCDHTLAQVTQRRMHVCNIRNLNSWPLFVGGTVPVHPHPSSIEAAYGLDLYLRLFSVMK